MLYKAKEKMIKGVISLVHDESLASTPLLRSNIRALPFRTLLSDDEQNDGQTGLLRFSRDGKGQMLRRNDLLCLVYSPLGCPLEKFKSPLELVTVLSDAITAHRALLQDAQILRRDISDGNIIISEKDRRGILIDLDVAIDLPEEDPDENDLVGTKHCMAIGLLKGNIDNYRYDLESFLYVLVWTIRDSIGGFSSSRLMRWRKGGFKECAAAKLEDMTAAGFELMLAEWTTEFEAVKPLARRLREVFFQGATLESIVFEADMSEAATNALYDGVLGAFEESIASLRLNGM